jgi:hypothetical protein
VYIVLAGGGGEERERESERERVSGIKINGAWVLRVASV